MPNKIDLLLEAERRGILPEDKKPLLEEARRRGLVPSGEYGGGPVTGAERFVRRMTDTFTFGFNDKMVSAQDAALNQLGFLDDDEVRGKGFWDTYSKRLEGHRRRTQKAFESPEDAGQFLSDTAASTLGLGGSVVADPVAAVANTGRAGLAAMRAAYEGVVPAAQAGAEALRTGYELGRHAFTYGALGAYGHSDDGGVESVGDIAQGGLEGVKFAYGLANALRSVGAVRDWVGNRRAPATEERAARAQEMQEAAGDTFGPAVSGSGTAQRTAQGLGPSVVGGPLRDQAGRVITGIEERAQRTLNEQTGGASPDAMGQQTQDFLRHQLTERSIPSERVNAMRPEELQDITNLPLPERYMPQPERVQPVPPRQVAPVNPEDYLNSVREGVPANQPEYPPVVEPRKITMEEFRRPDAALEMDPALEARRGEIAQLKARLDKFHAEEQPALGAEYEAIQAEAKKLGFKIEGFDNGSFEFQPIGALSGRRPSVRFDQHGKFDDTEAIGHRAQVMEIERRARRLPSYRDPGRPYYQVDPAAERDRVAHLVPRIKRLQSKAYEIQGVEQRIGKLEKEVDAGEQQRAQQAATTRAEAEARQRAEYEQALQQEAERVRVLNENNRLNAEARAYQQQQEAREAAVAAARPTAELGAAARTDQMRALAAREAENETLRLQAEANARHEAQLQERLQRQASDFRLGANRNETYVTEADAAYAMTRAHTPVVQRNPLGRRDEGALSTATNRLLDSIGQEARGGAQLPGYRNGQIFDESGGLQPALLDYLRPRLGSDITDRLANLSQRRARNQFSPAIQGLHDIRTAIGRAIEHAGRDSTDSAMLRRLYQAFDEDITNARNAGPGGRLATDLRQMQDANYEELLNDIRRPLTPLFSGATTPVQAMDRLATAARNGELGLLRSYMRVMTDKGDPARAAATIVSHMADGARDMGSFLRGFGEMRPEARDILFHGPEAQRLRAELERLERVGRRMQPYERMARAPGGIDLSGVVSQVYRPSNLLAAAGLYFHFWPTMMAVAGSAGIARFMASPRYVRWLTELPSVTRNGPRSPEALRHLAALASIAKTDGEGGKEIVEAASQMFLPNQALAWDAQDEIDMLNGRAPSGPGEQPPDEEEDEQYRINDQPPDQPPAWRRAGRNREKRDVHAR